MTPRPTHSADKKCVPGALFLRTHPLTSPKGTRLDRGYEGPPDHSEVRNEWDLFLHTCQPQYRSTYLPRRPDWRWQLLRPTDNEDELRFHRTGRLLREPDDEKVETKTVVRKDWVRKQISKKPLPEPKVAEKISPPFVDETQDVDAETWNKIQRSLNDNLSDMAPEERHHELDAFVWFPGATPVNAIFPPGVPMSGAEILAFYPHHIRWPQVARRLWDNHLSVSDIIEIQNWFRDSDTAKLPSTGGPFIEALSRSQPRGVSNRSLDTSTFAAPDYIQRYGMVVPTFRQLACGLKFLPSGVDARALTVVMRFWLDHQDLGGLDVLDTADIFRILQAPLRKVGPMNLDAMMAREWKERGLVHGEEIPERKRTGMGE